MLLGVFSAHSSHADDALDRLTETRLAAVRAAIEQLATTRQQPPQSSPWRHHRANLHVHSSLSHDSRGKIEDIVAAAKKVGTSVLLFTEHPAESFHCFRDGHQGMRDGVLLMPGAETRGLLVFPRDEIVADAAASPQELSDAIRNRDGLTFLSHLEERMDWELRGLTGVEIYNTHADVKDEKALLASLRNPLWMMRAAELLRKYPQESFSALQDYPRDYLRRWDALCAKTPHTGIAANDAHQNIGLTLRVTEANKFLAEDALGKKLVEWDAKLFSAFLPVPADARAGTTLYHVLLDPYECSLRHVGTHLLLAEHTPAGVRDALNKGRAYVAFDWLADAQGFDFTARQADKRVEMGEQITWTSGIELQGVAPLAGHWRLLRDGELLTETQGRSCQHQVAKEGIYRVELWLEVAGSKLPWILANPIYIRGS